MPQTGTATHSDLGGRVLVAIPAVLLVVAIDAAGGLVWLLVVEIFGLICLSELLRMSVQTRPVTLGSAIGLTLFGLCWVGVCLVHAVLLRELPHGEWAVIDVLAGTFLGDTGAYVGGRTIGRRKLAPRISPNKTVEGLLIGMVTALAAIFLLGLTQSWLTNGQALLLGLGVAVVAPLGDLFESGVKRHFGVKDSGKLFGPHGGALDRIDATLFALVVGYWIWQAFV